MQTKTIFSKDFILIVLGQIISLFGNQILGYALPLYLLNQTGSSALFGAISAFSFIPMLILFPIGGIIADRANKKNIMVILDFSTAALTLIFCLLVGRMSIVPLMSAVLILLYGIKGAYQPTVKASIPAIIDREHIIRANSIVDVVSSSAQLAGPVIGGILLSAFGLAPILYVSICCFFASAVMEIFICIPFEKKQAEGNIFVTGFSDLKESFGFIFKKRPALWKMSMFYAFVNLILNPLILIATPVLVTQRLGFSESDANRLYGYAQGIIAAGSILGGMLAGVLAKKLRPGAIPIIISGCALLIVLQGLSLQLSSGRIFVYLVLAVGGGLLLTLETLVTVQIMSYIQILTPKDLVGKIISCVMCVCMCTNPIGQFIYGVVFENIGEFAYISFYAAGLIALSVCAISRGVFRNIEYELKP